MVMTDVFKCCLCLAHSKAAAYSWPAGTFAWAWLLTNALWSHLLTCVSETWTPCLLKLVNFADDRDNTRCTHVLTFNIRSAQAVSNHECLISTVLISNKKGSHSTRLIQTENHSTCWETCWKTYPGCLLAIQAQNSTTTCQVSTNSTVFAVSTIRSCMLGLTKSNPSAEFGFR